MGKINKSTRLLTCLAILVFVSTFTVRDAIAQDNNQSRILSMSEFTIKGGHEMQFREGVSAWKTCYLEHDGEWEWNMWSRVQGEGTVYALTSYMNNWAEMDDNDDEAGAACQSLAQNMIVPHIESSERNMARTIPEMSKSPTEAMDVISAYYWRVGNGTKFMDTVKSVESVLRQVEGEPRGFWFELVGGDLNAPHFFVVTPYANFAAMDSPMDGVWDVVEESEGKKTRDQLQADYRDAVDQAWSFMWRRVGDLSHAN